jgi:hypothetical protein
MALGVVCLMFHLKAGALLIVVGAVLVVISEQQRKRKPNKQ